MAITRERVFPLEKKSWGTHTRSARRALGGIGLVTITVSLIAACSSGGAGSVSASNPSGGGGPAPATVHIAGPVNALYAPDELVLGKDYLGKVESQFHTKFVFDVLGSSTAQVDAFLGGNDQFVMVQASSLYPAAAAGKDFLAINQSSVGGSQIMVGNVKYKSSRGTKIAKYDGGTWCYTTVGSGSYVGDQVAAQAAGLDWSKQKQLAVGSVSGFLPALLAGRCDIAGEDSTSAASAILGGAGYTVQNQSSQAVDTQIYGTSTPLVGGTFDTSKAFASQYPQLVQAIDTAFVKAEIFEQKNKANPQTIYAAMPKQFTSANSLASFIEQWQLQEPCLITGSGIIPTASIGATTGFLKTVGGVSGETSRIAADFTNKYTLAAYKELGLPTPPADGRALTDKQLAGATP